MEAGSAGTKPCLGQALRSKEPVVGVEGQEQIAWLVGCGGAGHCPW
jgi:hypothetical protein